MIKPLDALLAIKVLGLVPGLNANDRRVGAVLLEHFNRKNGRCDPGLKRIADLLEISERTVIRCNSRLERAGLFRRVRHGGYSNRNSYEPVWNLFREYENAWRSKLQEKAKSRVTRLSRANGQDCHLHDDRAVTQTCTNNLPQLTCSRGLPKKQIEEVSDRIKTLAGKRSADAARDEAERRWNCDLDDRFRSKPVTYTEIVEAITTELQAAATDAELRRRGAGIEHIIRQLKLG